MSQLLISISEIPKLSSGARRALIGLISFRNKATGDCHPGFDKLCVRMGIVGPTDNDRRKVRRWLAELRARGIAVGRRRRFGGAVWWDFPDLAIEDKNVRPYRTKMSPMEPSPPYSYEQTNRTEERAVARIPPRKSRSITPRRQEPSMDERVLAAYYAEQRRKAGR